MRTLTRPSSARAVRGLLPIGAFVIASGAIGMVLGLVMISAVLDGYRQSLDVSESAVTSVADTVDVAVDISEGASAAIAAASESAASAAATTEATSETLAEVALFLETELPADLEAIERSMPAAIQAADTVDGALRALSLFGVDYDPDERFGDSLRTIQDSLSTLPDEVRMQGGAVGDIAPSASALSSDVTDLAAALEGIDDDLQRVEGLTAGFTATVAAAEAAIDDTQRSLDRASLLLRLVIILAGLTAMAIGFALLRVDQAIQRITGPDPLN